MGDSPMWVAWHGRLARDSHAQTDAPSKHMGESPVPLNPIALFGFNKSHAKLALTGGQPVPRKPTGWKPVLLYFVGGGPVQRADNGFDRG